ncbi:hypothetical protein PUN28_005717 [Cardiocondyla obscurior]|uniref:Uncharacterized protein n=1 Tax=Cardiocondyla obscurior TaxID=286306 RepID=A0AAW2G517_9HYME
MCYSARIVFVLPRACFGAGDRTQVPALAKLAAHSPSPPTPRTPRACFGVGDRTQVPAPSTASGAQSPLLPALPAPTAVESEPTQCESRLTAASELPFRCCIVARLQIRKTHADRFLDIRRENRCALSRGWRERAMGRLHRVQSIIIGHSCCIVRFDSLIELRVFISLTLLSLGAMRKDKRLRSISIFTRRALQHCESLLSNNFSILYIVIITLNRIVFFSLYYRIIIRYFIILITQYYIIV